MGKKQTFEDNFKLLEILAKDLQNGQISVDDLVPKMKEAAHAMKICKDVLKETKLQIQEIEKEILQVIEDTDTQSNDDMDSLE